MFLLQGTHVHFTSPVAGNLNGDVGGRTKAIHAKPLPRLNPAEPQGAIPDDAGTGGAVPLLQRKIRRNRIGKRGRDHCIFGVPAVDLIAGEAGGQTQIFPAAPAMLTLTTSALQPGDAHSLAGPPDRHTRPDTADDADSLMTRDQRQFRALELALDHMQIGSTDAAHADFNEHLAGSGFGNRNVLEDQRIGSHVPDVSENHCPHGDERAANAGNEHDVLGSRPMGIRRMLGLRLDALDVELDQDFVAHDESTAIE